MSRPKRKAVRIRVKRPKRTPPPPNTIPDGFQFLADSGLLFHLNVKVFHPMGLELEPVRDAAGRVVDLRVLNYRYNPAAVLSNADWEAGRAKFEKFREEWADPAMKLRLELLGFMIQKGPL